MLRPLHAFLLEDIRGALVACEEIRAIIGSDKGLQRLHTGEQTDEIVLPAERKNRVDEVVANACFLLLDLEAVGEEVDYLPAHLHGRFHPDDTIGRDPDFPGGRIGQLHILMLEETDTLILQDECLIGKVGPARPLGKNGRFSIIG